MRRPVDSTIFLEPEPIWGSATNRIRLPTLGSTSISMGRLKPKFSFPTMATLHSEAERTSGITRTFQAERSLVDDQRSRPTGMISIHPRQATCSARHWAPLEIENSLCSGMMFHSLAVAVLKPELSSWCSRKRRARLNSTTTILISKGLRMTTAVRLPSRFKAEVDKRHSIRSIRLAPSSLVRASHFHSMMEHFHH